MAVTLAAVRNTCVPVLKDVTVTSVSAAYATLVVQGLMWTGRQVSSLMTATPAAAASTVVSANDSAPSAPSEDYATQALGVLTAVATAASNAFKTGLEHVTSPVGLATVLSAVTDTTVEKGCDLFTHLSKKQVSVLVREPAKAAAAVGVYYVAGATVVPAALSYAAYRIASHYASKFFSIEKAKTA